MNWYCFGMCLVGIAPKEKRRVPVRIGNKLNSVSRKNYNDRQIGLHNLSADGKERLGEQEIHRPCFVETIS